MGVEYIEKRRSEFVKVEAQQLFDLIVAQVITQTPANVYSFTVSWNQRSPVIDEMIFQKASDLFREFETKLIVSRTSSNVVTGTVVVGGEELETKKLDPYYWSRAPGKFVSKRTGEPLVLPGMPGPNFTGTVREWYETFVETLIDAGNSIHKVALAAPDCVHVSRDAATIIEASILYRPSFNDAHPYMGILCNRFKIYLDDKMQRDTATVSLSKDNVRHLVEVKILDMNII